MTPVKFSLGLAQAGLGALVLAAGSSGLVLILMVLAYLPHTTGVMPLSCWLICSNVLSVKSVLGVMMGSWFLATAYLNYSAACKVLHHNTLDEKLM